MPRPKHSHTTSRASVAGAVLGIVLIASAVAAMVPVAMRWPASWPGGLVVVVLGGLGVALIKRHIFRHRDGRTAARLDRIT